ncbi:MAG: hypothetical protein SPJ62_01440 [Inconstantimicrobium porci]|uniref:hypothetical protein n=1 Tax=Inconstantimicrobium porci TaxID=2652291 RepID=UPI002A90F0A4|nr:hypothetical protein [Inconstantimicrobium porci]MDY5910679.1 hypothetical protein [Inconstantimicrobium porci]
MYLYHYYDKKQQPFLNLSDLSVDKAKSVLNKIKKEKPDTMAAKRSLSYVEDRLSFEAMLRDKFIEQGGIIRRRVPYYMVVEECAWLSSWFEDSAYIKIDVSEFDLRTVSFTYGDSHPTFSPRVNDGKEYRKKLYFYDDIIKLIDKYGLPQDWNADGKYGPERYIEAQIWSDEPILRYIKDCNFTKSHVIGHRSKVKSHRLG